IALDTTSGRVLGELADAGSRLRLGAFAPLPGDARLIAQSDRTGDNRPLLWDVVRGARVDFALDGLEGEAYPEDWSPDGKRVLLVQVARAVHRLHVLNVADGTLTPLQHPAGTYEQLYFAPDATIHAVWEDSTHPPQVIAL